jgi:hypothetical protein
MTDLLKTGVKRVTDVLNSVNDSKYFAGIAMIVLNLGSKYLIMELSESQEELMSNKIVRRFILFTVAFIATRDIYVSFIITAIFVLLVSNIFNENSKYSVVKKNKKLFKQISREDYMKATKLKELYELQQMEVKADVKAEEKIKLKAKSTKHR